MFVFGRRQPGMAVVRTDEKKVWWGQQWRDASQNHNHRSVFNGGSTMIQKELLDLYGCWDLKFDAISPALKYLLEPRKAVGGECN